MKMKQIQSIAILLLFNLSFQFLFAHNIDYSHVVLRHWSVASESKFVEGSFYMYKNGEVFIEDANHQILRYPINSLSENDQAFVQLKSDQITNLNNQVFQKKQSPFELRSLFDAKFWVSLLLLTMLGIFVLKSAEGKQVKYLVPVLSVGMLTLLYSFTDKIHKALLSTTDPATVDSAFTPFKPNVVTHWDSTYFYVESYGVPTTHEMMVGISNHGWQQQVPIPQCYTGNNTWPIPLNPVMAANPIPVDSIHFTRGAIAVAANGIPIFNYHTNTGVDSYIDGQLDNYGGHCGRADDYHYHIAPLHLYNHTTTNLPVAYGLDGYAVYGSVEPDGTAMQTLDANHGHSYGGVYHYHGTSSAPYMIARMAGEVTEDGTHQLIPQAAAHPIRPSRTPLNGALITSCQPNSSNNGYTLTYTLGGLTDSIVYNWTANGNYTFKYYTQGNGTSLDSIYHGFIPCYTVPTSIVDFSKANDDFGIFPNPASSEFYLKFNEAVKLNEIQNVSVFNLSGQMVYQTKGYNGKINLENTPKGVYLVKVGLLNREANAKIIVE